ncbi:ATP-binding protein [Gimesia sp.]|uniref:AAA family ATPase n=1 Tax=Gimesia sp. TaxID=2024833 RepID=UPI000C42F977|nr:ATP-binding protein [Gimesia sp.]MAX37522.1 ATPase [Gimesia sp.]|tara:strand:+ start:1883 stop:2869 length:987 start_codon:yes stop_codon:yes gene_type:complete
MATAEQIKSLVRSHTEGDDQRFHSVIMQIAAHAAKAGKSNLAHELRDLVDDAKRERERISIRPVPLARPKGELAGLATASYPKLRLADMVLNSNLEDTLNKVLTEYRQSDRLRSYGLSPRRKLLLVGPPGCGKTMTASALAGELSLPLLSVQLHAVITKYMGETAAKLHLLFDAMLETRGVYFFDEFDAIGGHRKSVNDVGEMRRVLNSFLMFLERDDSESIIVAATNLVEMLDPALFRRFDEVIKYSPPDRPARENLIKNKLCIFDIKRLGWKKILDTSDGLSHADITRACDDAAKEMILSDKKTIPTSILFDAIQRQNKLLVTRSV